MKLLQLLLWQLEKLLKSSSRVPEQPFFDPADFVWTRNLEEGCPAIRKELDEVMRQELAPHVGGRFSEARTLFRALSVSDELDDFLTVPAYRQLLAGENL